MSLSFTVHYKYDIVYYALHIIPSRCRIEYAASFPDNQKFSRCKTAKVTKQSIYTIR